MGAMRRRAYSDHMTQGATAARLSPRIRILPGKRLRVEVSEPYHFGPEGQTPGPDPKRSDYNSYLSFSDPDGNGWLVQEVVRAIPGE